MATNSCPELLVVTANCDFFVQFRHMCDNVMFAVDATLTLTYTLMCLYVYIYHSCPRHPHPLRTSAATLLQAERCVLDM
jgi:hypothetical protein